MRNATARIDVPGRRAAEGPFFMEVRGGTSTEPGWGESKKKKKRG